MLLYATQEKMHWLTIAVNDSIDTKFRKDFFEVLNINDFKGKDDSESP
jgi:hypothetical protein